MLGRKKTKRKCWIESYLGDLENELCRAQMRISEAQRSVRDLREELNLVKKNK